MNLKQLINKALKDKPPALDIYGEYYSPYYNLMYILAGTISRGLLVELGVEGGRGLASLASAKNDNMVIGLDTNKHPALDIVLAKFPSIFYLKYPSLPVCDLIARFERPISLLHIDTEHSYSMAKAEFEAYKPYLANGAYVLFDDLHAQDDDVLRYPHIAIESVYLFSR